MTGFGQLFSLMMVLVRYKRYLIPISIYYLVRLIDQQSKIKIKLKTKSKYLLKYFGK